MQRVGRGIMGWVVVGELEIWRAAGAGEWSKRLSLTDGAVEDRAQSSCSED